MEWPYGMAIWLDMKEGSYNCRFGVLQWHNGVAAISDRCCGKPMIAWIGPVIAMSGSLPAVYDAAMSLDGLCWGLVEFISFLWL